MTPSEFREHLDIHKTRMNGLSCGEESMTIYSAVYIGCQRVTDGRTDGRTDVKPIAITCFSIADARKKCIESNTTQMIRLFIPVAILPTVYNHVERLDIRYVNVSLNVCVYATSLLLT